MELLEGADPEPDFWARCRIPYGHTMTDFTRNLWVILSRKVSSIGIPPLLLLSLDVIKCSMTVFCLLSVYRS